jgi:thiol-disulfide isomerase/thioredoxin
MVIRKIVFWCFALTLVAATSQAGDLVRGVRYKISAGDLASGVAAVEDYKRATGVDAEYLDAVGWLARGAELLHRPDLAAQYVAEVRRNVPAEKDDLLLPLGAAIEVQAKLLAASDGRGAAVCFLEGELSNARATSLRSRISKNIDLLSLEGHPALPLDMSEYVGAAPASLDSLRGKPVLLYFWAWYCGDCKAQSAALTRIWQKYQSKGLAMITATRLYGSVEDKPATPAVEKAEVEKVWKELYGGLDGVSGLISTETMVRYGVSATPTFALIDRKGRIRLYTPTRLSEAELSRRIDEVLAE